MGGYKRFWSTYAAGGKSAYVEGLAGNRMKSLRRQIAGLIIWNGVAGLEHCSIVIDCSWENKIPMP